MKRNHVSIWNWIQKHNPQKIASKKKEVDEFVIDETVIKVGSKVIWLWVAIEPKDKQILALSISKERTMQYIKDTTESFDDNFPCILKNCKLKHVMNWLRLFADRHNSELKTLK